MPAKKKTPAKKTAAKVTKKEMSLKDIKALIKFAKEQGVKNLKIKGLEFEFEDLESNIEDFLPDSNKEEVKEGIKDAVAVQDLRNREVQDDKAVKVEVDDLWSIS